MADFFELLDLIRKSHPDIFGLLSKPGVLKVALDMEAAEAAGQPWTTAQIEAAMGATEYYRTSDTQQRSWDVLQATDPASASTKILATQRLIDNLQTQLGISFSNDGGLNSMHFWMVSNAVRNGWTADEIKYQMLASVNKTVPEFATGEVGSNAVAIRQTMNDYGVPMSDKGIMGWAINLASGAVDQKGIIGYAQQSAMSLFPGLRDAISRGITVRQYADPYMQIAQQELGIDPKNESFTDPKWMRAINSIDPKTGQRVSMNLSDWTSVVRSDPTYGYDKTAKAAAQGADFANQISHMMGAVG